MPGGMGSFWTKDQTDVPCFGMQILNHWITREAPTFHFLMIPFVFPPNLFFLFSSFLSSYLCNFIFYFFKHNLHITIYKFIHSYLKKKCILTSLGVPGHLNLLILVSAYFSSIVTSHVNTLKNESSVCRSF